MSQLVPIKTSKLSPFEQSSIEMGDLTWEIIMYLGQLHIKALLVLNSIGVFFFPGEILPFFDKEIGKFLFS
jgi:hypothetical protein